MASESDEKMIENLGTKIKSPVMKLENNIENNTEHRSEEEVHRSSLSSLE